jgi:hypothetical protein
VKSEVAPPKSSEIEDNAAPDELASPADFLLDSLKESTATILSEGGFGYQRLEDVPLSPSLSAIAEKLSNDGDARNEDEVFEESDKHPPGLSEREMG